MLLPPKNKLIILFLFGLVVCMFFCLFGRLKKNMGLHRHNLYATVHYLVIINKDLSVENSLIK